MRRGLPSLVAPLAAVFAGALLAAAVPLDGMPSSAPAGMATGIPHARVDAGAAWTGDLPRSSLDVRVEGRWIRWWRSDGAPQRWRSGSRALAGAARWETIAPGVEQGELRLRGSGEAWRLRLVLVRLDLRQVSVRQVLSTRDAGTLGAWTIDSVGAGPLVAFNGGHFAGGEPWGWIVRDGREAQPPGTGSLAAAIVFDSAGALRIIHPDSIEMVRQRGGTREVLQSYPMLLHGDGVIPPELRARNDLIDLGHRDARLAIGVQRDGRAIIAMTRFDALDGRMSSLPFGPTIPEIAAIMGGLGCHAAVLLDGGISAQLLLQPPGEARREWRGMRRVPVGVLVEPRGT